MVRAHGGSPKSPSSSGPGHRPFTAKTRVRLSLGTPFTLLIEHVSLAWNFLTHRITWKRKHSSESPDSLDSGFWMKVNSSAPPQSQAGDPHLQKAPHKFQSPQIF